MKIKITYLFLLFWMAGLIPYTAQVGVNILTPHKTAAFQVESSTSPFRGLLSPTMTTANRNSIANGTITIPADGLMVFDKDHHMHYFYNGTTNRWNSMSPLTLSTPSVGSLTYPSGAITTPNSIGTFQLGINKQTPTEALDVIGNATVSGNVNVGGNENVSGNSVVGGNAAITGNLSVTGFQVNALVPSGTIVMWTGATPPAGWAECDGNNGTPDLRGRFIVAAGQSTATTVPGDVNHNYTVNQTGGKNEYFLSAGESGVPPHSHTTVPHRHTFIDTNNSDDDNRGAANDQAADANEVNHNSITDYATVIVDPNVAQNATSTHENRPQFFVLKFIMKL